MTRLEAILKLKELQKSTDSEAAQCEADNILCALLYTLGCEDVVTEYRKVPWCG